MRHRPLLLAQATRFAGLPRPHARAVLALVAALILLALAASLTVPAAEPQPDLALHTQIVEQVRHGAPYYPTATDARRSAGLPLHPFVTVRLPTLTAVQAALPAMAVIALLWALAGAAIAAWWQRLAPATERLAGKAAALLLLMAGTAALWRVDLAPVHELWAGLFIALSLARRHRDHWLEAVAYGLAAMLIHEAAALYVAVMAGFALADRCRAEALGWAAALGVLGIALGCHAYAVAQLVGPLDPTVPGWTELLGPGVVHALAGSTALTFAPPALGGPLLALALLGWAGWRDELGVRMIGVASAYALLIAIVAQPDTAWALLVAPASLAGLLFAPDALRDLLAPVLDKRRITVRRVVR